MKILQQELRDIEMKGKILSIFLCLLTVGCTTIEITEIRCDANSTWPRCQIKGEKVELEMVEGVDKILAQ